MIAAVMVDLDGTLADTAGANSAAYRRALEEAGVALTHAEVDVQVQGRHWSQFLPEILAQAGCTAEPAEIAARKAEFYHAGLPDIHVNAALVALLRAIKTQFRLALVTSASRKSAEALLEAHGLRELFDCVVTGDDVVRHKPDPEAYQKAAAMLSVLPEQCLIYEDSDIGVASAVAFGGHVIRIVFQSASLKAPTRPGFGLGAPDLRNLL